MDTMTPEQALTAGKNDGLAHQYNGTRLPTLPEFAADGEFFSLRDYYDAGYDSGVLARSGITLANA